MISIKKEKYRGLCQTMPERHDSEFKKMTRF